MQPSKPLTTTTPPQKTFLYHQTRVLALTFLAYAAYHASRKPPSIVKSILTNVSTSTNTNTNTDANSPSSSLINSNSTGSGWAPFNGPHGPHRLGELDVSFLASYSISMFISGHAADRLDLRLFLSSGMVLSAASSALIASAFFLRIHRLSFFLAVSALSGIFQSTGWPTVVSVVSNWLSHSPRRGLIMGLWNSHTSFGNILGSVLASSVLDLGWGWSFLLPSLLIASLSVPIFSLLIVRPEDAGFICPANEIELPSASPEILQDRIELGEEQGLIQSGSPSDSSEGADYSSPPTAIGFLEAWTLPGVAPFAFCLFFSKLVAYTFLYWLPFYISQTAVAGKHLSDKTAGILSTIFDFGGVLGGISAGYISDKIEARAVTSILFLTLSVPALTLYRLCGSISIYTNIGLMFLSGLFVNGPYALITTAVAADLGTQSIIKGNSRALATVTAIIDGTGSVGAALGPLMTGYISTKGWNAVFAMLVLSVIFAALFLIHLAKAEIKSKMIDKKWFWDRT